MMHAIKNNSNPIIELLGVSKTFVNNVGDRLNLINSVNFKLFLGDSVCFLGDSGIGKTTLLQIIGLIEPPTSGSIVFCNETIPNYTERTLSKLRKNYIGYIHQDCNLINELNVIENAMIASLIKGDDQDISRSLAKQALKDVGLIEKQLESPLNLSGGEKQRLAIARAIAKQPKLILADEPTGNLDSTNSEIIINLITNLTNSYNMASIVITHSLSVAEKMDKVYLLSGGKLNEKSNQSKS